MNAIGKLLIKSLLELDLDMVFDLEKGKVVEVL